jgi:hypothetical protein
MEQLSKIMLLRAQLINNEAEHALKDAKAYTTFSKFKEADDKMAEAEALMRQVSHLTSCVEELVHND